MSTGTRATGRSASTTVRSCTTTVATEAGSGANAVLVDHVADDVIAVADALASIGSSRSATRWGWSPSSCGTATAARVDGLVLCATAPYFAELRGERLSFLGLTGLAALARVTPAQAREWLTGQFYLQRKSLTWEPWAVQQAASHDWRMMLEAGSAIGNFTSSAWIRSDRRADVDRRHDARWHHPVAASGRVVRRIPGAEAFRVDGEHDAVVTRSDQFVPTLLRAIESVVNRVPLDDR